MKINEYAHRVGYWVVSRLGIGAMDPVERGRRMLEEALELAQALSVTEEEADNLLIHVYGKPPGIVAQEIGGLATTLLAVSIAAHIDFEFALQKEVERIESLSPERFRDRQRLNAQLGIGKTPE